MEGEYPTDYDDADKPFTPAWSEKYTGISREVLIRFAREWGTTALRTDGKCTIIIGAGINHWYHANLMYRAGIHALMFCGCVGKNGGGLAHYVGQEKLAPMESWASIALAKDWYPPSRLQNTPSWHYVHSDQWRYEKDFTDYHTVPTHASQDTTAQGHTMDMQVRAVRQGWLPFYPQFPENPIEVVKRARASGAKTEAEVVAHIANRLQEKQLKFSRRRSGRGRELASSVVYLERQRPDVQCQGARVFSEALSGHAHQPRGPKTWPRNPSERSPGMSMRLKARWIWLSI